MDAAHLTPEANEDSGLDRPVVVLTDEVIATMQEEERLNPPLRDPKTISSILGDYSVYGYPNDETPLCSGIKDILKVVNIVEESNIPCCMVAEPALNYYGADRIIFVSIIRNPSRAFLFLMLPMVAGLGYMCAHRAAR